MNRTKGIGSIDILILLALIGVGAILMIQRSDYVQAPLRVEKDRENLRALEYAEILYEIDHMAEMFATDESEGDEDSDADLLEDEMPGDTPAEEQLTARPIADLAPYLLDWKMIRSPYDGSEYTLMVKEFGYEIRSSAADDFIDSGVYSWEQAAAPATEAAPSDSTTQQESNPEPATPAA
jgi:hypothetical protein